MYSYATRGLGFLVRCATISRKLGQGRQRSGGSPLFMLSICLVYIYYTSNKNFILKYFRCRDGKRTETRIGMEGICITHSCIPLYTVYMQHIMAHSGGMQEWVIQIPSIPILVSVLFPSLHLKNKIFVTSLCSFYAHAHETTPTSGYKLSHTHIVVEEGP